MHACIAAGDRFPAGKHFFDDEAERQRGHAQVDALDAQRRQTYHQADSGRQQRCAGQRQGKGPAHAYQHRLGVGPHAQKGSMAQRKQPGKAGQQHQAQARDGIDEHKGQLCQPVFGKQPGGCQQQQPQGAVPEDMARVLGKTEVLPVVSFENETHGVFAGSDFFAELFAEKPVGFDHQHDQHHHIGGHILEAVGQIEA